MNPDTISFDLALIYVNAMLFYLFDNCCCNSTRLGRMCHD